MKNLYRFFGSPILALLLLLVFATSMAVATFVENDYGTATAWQLIYDSLWFELVMLGLGLCFVANIAKYRLWKRAKWSVLLFHIAFIVILIGAAVTRYTASTGVMRIRENSMSSTVISDQNYLTLHLEKDGNHKTVRKRMDFSPVRDNDFVFETDFKGQPIQVSYVNFVADAAPEVVDAEDGQALLQLVVTEGEGRETILLKKGDVQLVGQHGHRIGFESQDTTAVDLVEEDGKFFVRSPEELDFFVMAEQVAGKIAADSLQSIGLRTLFRSHDFSFVPLSYHPSAKLELVSTAEKPGDNDSVKDDALVVKVKMNGEIREATLLYREGFLPTVHPVSFEGMEVSLSYGSAAEELPFALKLRDFQLERYPGSESPSSYASEVSIVEGDSEEPFRIYMNHVLDHGGYRFYQASYDTDEKGTVLSVNRDRPGAMITYLGYLLMGLGMFWTFFGKGSRFRQISTKLSRLQRKQLLLLPLFFTLFLSSPAQTAQRQAPMVDADIADSFGRLLVQDLDGRIKPINTLASEFLRKLTRKTTYSFERGDMRMDLNADQVFLAVHMAPKFWEGMPLIKVDMQKLGSGYSGITPNSKSLVAFKDLLEASGDYKLQQDVEKANQKKPAERNEFDKEVLKVDDRFNLLYNVFIGNYMRIFPNKQDANDTWFSYTHHFNDFPEEDARFAKNVMPRLFDQIIAQQWSDAAESLSYIDTYQQVLGADIIPSEQRVNAELWYNRMNINFWMFQVYFTLGFLLLVVALARIFSQRVALRWAQEILIVLTLIGFLVFTGNVILRWYVAGHAPWSNGYEMLVFVAWCLLLCGLLVHRKSEFALPLATLFSGALLFVSYLDWLNPEITNLMPVLKSYWLKVHVATIVSSYAPLALSAVLGLMVLLLIIIRKPKTSKVIDIRIKELTYINELSMTIGLFVLAIGTFLGGVWANESWGRYWAWDPKETWALISIIVYAIVLHLRFVPALNNTYVLNTASLFAFWSIIMTSFGVNYYLSGLHSYAAGDPIPIPKFVYWVAAGMVFVALLGYFKYKKRRTSGLR